MADELVAAEGKAMFVHTDLKNGEFVQKMISATIKTFGKLDILINNAGYHSADNIGHWC